jgi:hypothetical protein
MSQTALLSTSGRMAVAIIGGAAGFVLSALTDTNGPIVSKPMARLRSAKLNAITCSRQTS